MATVGSEKAASVAGAAEGAATAAVQSDLSVLVAAEVARQVGAVRAELEQKIAELRERTPEDRAALVVFSGDLDRVMAAFVIATGAAAAGLETSMFFTFWGLSVLKKKGASGRRQGLQAADVRADDARPAPRAWAPPSSTSSAWGRRCCAP